ncbi:hypothetical protein [Persicobacter diffluens]
MDDEIDPLWMGPVLSAHLSIHNNTQDTLILGYFENITIHCNFTTDDQEATSVFYYDYLDINNEYFLLPNEYKTMYLYSNIIYPDVEFNVSYFKKMEEVSKTLSFFAILEKDTIEIINKNKIIIQH